MGFIDDINALDIDDAAKAKLIAAHEGEVNPLKASDREATAEETVEKFRKMGFSEENGCSGFLKRVRHIAISPDAHEPAAVLMSDDELGLSGDKALGVKSSEEVTLADEMINLFGLLPGAAEGKLKVEFSQQGLAAESGDKPGDGVETDSTKLESARGSLNKVTGQAVNGVSRKRYRRGGHAVATTGGDA